MTAAPIVAYNKFANNNNIFWNRRAVYPLRPGLEWQQVSIPVGL